MPSYAPTSPKIVKHRARARSAHFTLLPPYDLADGPHATFRGDLSDRSIPRFLRNLRAALTEDNAFALHSYYGDVTDLVFERIRTASKAPLKLTDGQLCHLLVRLGLMSFRR